MHAAGDGQFRRRYVLADRDIGSRSGRSRCRRCGETPVRSGPFQDHRRAVETIVHRQGDGFLNRASGSTSDSSRWEGHHHLNPDSTWTHSSLPATIGLASLIDCGMPVSPTLHPHPHETCHGGTSEGRRRPAILPASAAAGPWRKIRDGLAATPRRGEAPVTTIAGDIDTSDPCLRNWLQGADDEDGQRPGVTTSESAQQREATKDPRQGHLADALFDADRDDPEFGHRFLAAMRKFTAGARRAAAD